MKKQIITVEIETTVFGARVKELRLKRGFTQKQLAEKLNKSGHSIVNNWEQGKNTATLEDFVKICDALNTTPNYLLDYHEPLRPDVPPQPRVKPVA